ncbi:MAG TPA: WG repeat-containing protein, partial [Patescibacteria group bacterium]|nr:WG repeat-containing protein [Patescibacteria group bacterium]
MPQNKFESMRGPSSGEEEKEEKEKTTDGEQTETEEGSPEQENSPIRETPESISYLGVELPKAEDPDPEIVEPRERYENYINYQYALELQQKIAVSWKEGEPVLLEGGTSLGKTTTIRKMASELGYEVHYVNLNGQTDVEDLMGRHIANPDKTSENDPEYIFAEGEITRGLRQEKGKKKIIILDEINAAHSAILKRLNEVLDGLDKNGEVTLPEDASERVSVSKEHTKVAGLMNPPGEGYEGVNPISKELLRRWNYQKEPGELPPKAFSYMRKARRGKLPRTEEAPEEMFLYSNEGDLDLEQLEEIPGYDQIEEQFEEFHRSAKKLLEEQEIAEDQPQEIMFDDHEELRRFQQFILRYYNGDITETAQRALRFYYAGKLQDQKDKQKLEELINYIHYESPSDSRRRSVEDETKEEERSPEDPERETFSSEEEKDYEEEINFRSRLARENGYEWVGEFNEGPALAKKEDGHYFIDREGKQIAGPFQNAGSFSEGLALAKKEDGDYFIDSEGKEIAGPFRNAFSFSEGRAHVEKEGGHYFIDSEGKEIAGPFRNAFSFSEGLARVQKEGGHYFIDSEGKEIAGPFRGAFSFSEGRARVKKEDGRYFIDKEGKQIAGPFKFTDSFSEGRARVQKEGGDYFIDREGKQIAGPFQNTDSFSEGRARVKKEDGCYFIDKEGKEIAGPFKLAGSFSEGLAWVKKEDGHYFIDREGKQMAGPFRNVFPFSEGLAKVEKRDGKEIYIDKFGREFGSY